MVPGHTQVTVQVPGPSESQQRDRTHDRTHDQALAVEPMLGPATCPVRDVIDRVGDKWSVLLVVQLRDGPRRFSVLLRCTEGISRRMLTRTLRLLERDGLVSRSVRPSTPPQVAYDLTPLGHSLAGPLDTLTAWAVDNQLGVQAARAAFDAREDGQLPQTR